MLARKQLSAVAGNLVKGVSKTVDIGKSTVSQLHWVTKLISSINKKWDFANVGHFEQTLLHGLLLLLT